MKHVFSNPQTPKKSFINSQLQVFPSSSSSASSFLSIIPTPVVEEKADTSNTNIDVLTNSQKIDVLTNSLKLDDIIVK